MDLKEQYTKQHGDALAAVEKLASSLAPIGASAKVSPEIGIGGGGVGVGFNSPYITIELGADAAKLNSREGHMAHQIITQGTAPEKGLAHAVAEVFNAHLSEAQNIHTSRLVRANGNSININLEALSSGLRNNPQLEGVMANMGAVVQQTTLIQLAQAQGQVQGGGKPQQGKPQARQGQPAAESAPKKNPIGFAVSEKSSTSWANNVTEQRASSSQERQR